VQIQCTITIVSDSQIENEASLNHDCYAITGKHITTHLRGIFRARAVASRGASGARPLHIKSVSPHFMFGPSVAAYIQYCILKMCPPFWFLTPCLLNPGDGPVPCQPMNGQSSQETPKIYVTNQFMDHFYVLSGILIDKCSL